MPAAEAGLEDRDSSKGVFRALQRLCLLVSFKHCQQPILIMISVYYDQCCHARSQGEWKSFFWGEWDALFNSLGEPQTQTVSKPTDQEADWAQMSLRAKFERGELYTLLTSFPRAPGATTAPGGSSLLFPKHHCEWPGWPGAEAKRGGAGCKGEMTKTEKEKTAREWKAGGGEILKEKEESKVGEKKHL